MLKKPQGKFRNVLEVWILVLMKGVSGLQAQQPGGEGQSQEPFPQKELPAPAPPRLHQVSGERHLGARFSSGGWSRAGETSRKITQRVPEGSLRCCWVWLAPRGHLPKAIRVVLVLLQEGRSGNSLPRGVLIRGFCSAAIRKKKDPDSSSILEIDSIREGEKRFLLGWRWDISKCPYKLC